MVTAIVRAVGPRLGDCQLTHLSRLPINIDKATEEHRAYRECLARLGLRVIELPAEPDLPDAVFVEDTAVVLDEVAVITNPGATSRQPETKSIADALSNYRPLKFIQPPATLEGGDVLRVERVLYLGLTSRTNRQGVDQLRKIVEPYGYCVKAVEVGECLHLKTACTFLGRGMLLANREWINVDAFSEYELIDTPSHEPWAANTLRIGETLLLPSCFPQTRALLEANGYAIRLVDISELQKAEAGLTCLSVIFDSSQ
jgi:dimethylargininase